MKIKILIVLLLLTAGAAVAQNYPHVSIHDLQFVPDDSLMNNFDASAYVGDTVQVTGVVIVSTLVNPTFDRRPIMWAGARWQTYIRDSNYANLEWAGLNIIQNDTTGPNQNSLMDLLDTTQIVTVTGVISEFGRQTQLNVIPEFPVQFHGNKSNRGLPVEVTIDQLNTGTPPANNLLTGEKYENMYVIIRNVITSDRNTSTGTFRINDSNGNQLEIHDQSGYFTRRAHQLRTFDPPIDGTTIQYIRGVIGHFSNADRYVIRPMYPDDILIGQSPPEIKNIRRNIAVVGPNQPVTISAVIKDIDAGGSVVEAKIMYRHNEGVIQPVNMSVSSDTVWSGIVPGYPDSSMIDFFIWAKDNDGMIQINPIDTLRNKYFYFILNRPLTIQDIQYSPFGSGFGGYNNYRVTLTGVVTADTTDLQGDGNQVARRVYMQNGGGPWSGIWVFGNASDALSRGQNITVSGLINESNNNTRLDSITQIITNSTGNTLPDPEYVTTEDIAEVVNGTISAEKWEGVLIKYQDITVTDENADGNPGPNGSGNSNFGEISVADASNISTRVELQEGNHQYHNLWAAGLDTIAGNIRIFAGDSFTELRGVLFQSFGDYKLVPRKGDDFIGYLSDVADPLSLKDYSLSQNYPNPFNPATTINYSIPVPGFVQIRIYNILGQELMTLVNTEQTSGNYKVTFNASDFPSGVYLYQITVNDYQSTKKMLLLK